MGEENEEIEPTTFQEAWHYEDAVSQEKWREAIRLEFRQMIKNGVWKNKTLSQLPYGRQGIGTKWVFKKKKEGTYQARMVAKGYTQEAGIDFTYNFAPVVGDTTLRIMLVL